VEIRPAGQSVKGKAGTYGRGSIAAPVGRQRSLSGQDLSFREFGLAGGRINKGPG